MLQVKPGITLQKSSQPSKSMNLGLSQGSVNTCESPHTYGQERGTFWLRLKLVSQAVQSAEDEPGSYSHKVQ